ncbi:uncharacterized protein BX664DRAFT_324201 [Halteromyces radiatus]|uniref:uncharacterized protein n=1 Tax=Halteromyces radiatus TaxID=101107 RepID=UPI00221F6D69|nr:uncharacterized protein BX664DRAFT_324201 [Halteromyces radiatus]KAI8096532.1 hypothetical protein BX664DRAFT_324201 [Halteromyces radiatus]
MRSLFTSATYEEPMILDSSFTRKYCGIMSLRAGCALSCITWVAVGFYGGILAFQFKSPIFSYIDSGALIAQGVICLLLVLAGAAGLAGLYAESMYILNRAHKAAWFAVFAFLIDFFVSIVLFGIQQNDNANWCYEQSVNHVDEQVTTSNNTTLGFTPPTIDDFYNCNKLWQDELKFAIALYIIFLIFFLYWAWCLWAYTQKLRVLKDADYHTSEEFQMRQNFPPPPINLPFPPGAGLYNLPPGKPNHQHHQDQQQSLAEWTRQFIDRFKS